MTLTTFARVLAASLVPGLACGPALAGSDFNGDGKDDLAIGVPNEQLGTSTETGAVNIIMGGNAMTPSPLLLDLADFGMGLESSAHFGSAIACGDFDGDLFDDLAIGAPDTFGGGIVCIIFGSASGLDIARTQTLVQGTFRTGTLDLGGRFGAALCAGDFDDDGVDDLAIGAPDRDVDQVDEAGEVFVIHGVQDEGFNGDSLLLNINQNRTGPVAAILDSCEADDRYGRALCAFDFDGDGVDDLAIGIPEEDIGAAANAGAVNIIFSIEGIGLGFLQNSFFFEGTPMIPNISIDAGALANAAEAGDNFGASLASGDFGVRASEFLAIGIPGKRVFGARSAGAVGVLRFAEINGRMTMRYVCQDGFFDNRNVEDNAEDNERFGSAVAVGDFNNDGRDDLACGVPREDTGAFDNGAVHLFTSTAAAVTGFTGAADRLITQGLNLGGGAIDDQPETLDLFGSALAVGDFIGDNTTDLAVGAMFETLEATDDIGAGKVHVIPGSNTGLTGVADVAFTQDSPGVPGSPEEDDAFGFTLGRGR